jgi:hypothetical protein
MIALLLALQLAVPAGPFHHCRVSGSTTRTHIQAKNRLKNRAAVPTSADINPAITAAAIVAPGADLDRFTEHQAATIRVYVTDVKAGGIESVNCKAAAAAWRDTHIETNAEGPTYTGLPLIVEVTPRWRATMAAAGVDWSTAALKAALVGHWVTFTGWLFVDDEHAQNATHTNPEGTTLWRVTVVELHPITAITVE